jgi:hypothetical protein
MMETKQQTATRAECARTEAGHPVFVAAVLAWSMVLLAISFSMQNPDADAPPAEVASNAGVPLYFEANQGQSDAAVHFLARAPGYTAFASAGALSFRLGDGHDPRALRIALDHANADAPIQGESALAGRSHYFHGRDARQWQRDVPQFAQVRYRDVYPGIDWVLHGSGPQLEYDFIVAPGADPQAIRYVMQGADALQLREDGSLEAQIGERRMVQHPPRAWQEQNGRRWPVDVRAVVASSDHTVQSPEKAEGASGPMTLAFAVGDYDHGLPLVIDPVYEYSSYLGGSGAEGVSGGNGSGQLETKVAVDAAGNIYVAGITASADFPSTPGAFQPTLKPGPNCSSDPIDVFVAKFNPAGDRLIYATYLGGSCTENAVSLKVDSNGSAYLFGTTNSTDFPVTSGVIQPTPGSYPSQVFVTKFSADGSTLAYSTFLGGPVGGTAEGFALDAQGEVFVSGTTHGSFPTTSGAYRENCIGDFSHYLLKLKADASGAVFATCWGEGDASNHNLQPPTSQQGLAIDAAGEALVTGLDPYGVVPVTAGAYQTSFGGSYDGFVIKFKADGSGLVYATYLGGSGNDQPSSIAADAAGNAYVTGATTTGFPTTPNTVQPQRGTNGSAFAAKLDPTGSSLVYGTYLTGSGRLITVDSAGRALIIGNALTIVDAPPEACIAEGSSRDLLRLSADASTIDFGFAVGGSGSSVDGVNNSVDIMSDLAVSNTGDVLVAGVTNSANFPTYQAFQPSLANPAGGEDAFVARISTGASLPKPTLQFAASSFTADPGSGSAVITVQRSGRMAGPLQVRASTSDGTAVAGTDYTAVTTTLNWSNGDLSDKTFSVPLINPAAIGKTIKLLLDTPICTTAVGTPATALLTLGAAAASAGQLQFGPASYSVNENGGTVTITVTRSGGSSGAVGVSYATSDGSAMAGSDYVATSGSLSWSDGDTTAKTFTVGIVNDAVPESTEQFNLALSAPTGGAVLGTQSTASVSIIDDDVSAPPPTPVPGSLQFSSAGYSVNEGGGMATITVTRSSGSDGAVSVHYASADGSATAADYTAVTGTLSWANGDATPKTFSVPITDDGLVEGNETVNLTLSMPDGGAALGSPAMAVLTIVDNDSATPTPPPTTAVNGEGSAGGSGGSLVLALLPLAALRRRRDLRRGLAAAGRRSLASVLMVSALLLPALPTHADSTNSEDGPYVGLRTGVGYYLESEKKLDNALRARGHAVDVQIDDHQFSGELHFGVPVYAGIAAELGYVDLGQYDVHLNGTTPDPQRLAKDLASLLRPAGRGATFGLGLALPLTSWLSLSEHLGGVYYVSRQHARIGANIVDIDDDGFGLSGGLGLMARVTPQLQLGAGLEYFSLNGHPCVDQFGLQLQYRFSK